MYDQLIKGAIGLVIAAAAYFAADKVVEAKTGKHIHEHILQLFQKMRDKAKQWIGNHPAFSRVYIETKVLEDRILSAAKRKWDKITIPVFGIQTKSGIGVKIKELEEPVDLNDAVDFLGHAKENPILC